MNRKIRKDKSCVHAAKLNRSIFTFHLSQEMASLVLPCTQDRRLCVVVST
jgi:hypothetical protein